jgi:hypothetical protein
VDEHVFNMSIRTFLKEVGVSSQREIEIAVREALRAGRLAGSERLEARATVTLAAVGMRHEVTATIALE